MADLIDLVAAEPQSILARGEAIHLLAGSDEVDWTDGLDAEAIALVVRYLANTPRIDVTPRQPWQRLGTAGGRGPRAAWGAGALAGRGGPVARWGAATAAGAGGARQVWSGTAGQGVAGWVRQVWGAAEVAHANRRQVWGAAAPVHADAGQAWGAAALAARSAGQPWAQALRAERAALQGWAAARGTVLARRTPWGAAVLLPAVNRPRRGRRSAWGDLPRAQRIHLLACCLQKPLPPDGGVHLVAGDDCCEGRIGDNLFINARESLVQVHSIAAWRMPDLLPLSLDAGTLSAGFGSIGWTLEARGPVDLLQTLAPAAGVPARVRVSVNGMAFDVVVERLRRVRSFGRVQGAFTGRSVSMLLASPYAASRNWLNAVPMTAAQVVAEALEFSGVDLDWGITDWPLPAGAWSFSGTPLGVVSRVAEAAGAVVQSPRSGASVAVVPRYWVPPWEWANVVPDVTLSLLAMETDSYERRDQPAYEGVFLSGHAQGVRALVKRTGTGPALTMPLVTDELLTDLEACRQRGVTMLGSAGAQAVVSMTLPVYAGVGEPGIIGPGKLVLVVDDPDGDWYGMCTGVQVEIAGMAKVSQTITLERHL